MFPQLGRREIWAGDLRQLEAAANRPCRQLWMALRGGFFFWGFLLSRFHIKFWFTILKRSWKRGESFGHILALHLWQRSLKTSTSNVSTGQKIRHRVLWVKEENSISVRNRPQKVDHYNIFVQCGGGRRLPNKQLWPREYWRYQAGLLPVSRVYFHHHTSTWLKNALATGWSSPASFWSTRPSKEGWSSQTSAASRKTSANFSAGSPKIRMI